MLLSNNKKRDREKLKEHKNVGNKKNNNVWINFRVLLYTLNWSNNAYKLDCYKVCERVIHSSYSSFAKDRGTFNEFNFFYNVCFHGS